MPLTESGSVKVQFIKKKATKQSRHQRFTSQLNLDMEITKRIIASTKKQSATKEKCESREEETISTEGSVLVSIISCTMSLVNEELKKKKAEVGMV